MKTNNKAEEETDISQEKYHNLFETNRDSITLFRIDSEGNPGNFIEVNRATTLLFGYTKNELLALNITDLELVTNYKRKTRITSLLSQGKINFETIIKNKNGNLRNVEIKSVILNYMNAPAVMNITRDITDRKQAEENAKKAQENLASFLEAIPDLLFEVNLEGIIYYYQSNRNDLLPVPTDGFVGKKLQEVIPFDASNVCFEAMEEADEKGWSTGKQYSLDLPQGKCWFELSVSPIKEIGSKDPHFIMLARDITARKKAENDLQKSQEKLQGIFNVANSGIAIIDSSGNFLLFNDWYFKLLGYTRKEFQNLNTKAISYPDDFEKSCLLNKKIIEGEIDHYQIEKRYIRKDKSLVWCEISASAIKDYDNNVVNILRVIIDITERKKAEIALQESETRLIEAQTLAKVGNWETDFSFTDVIWSKETEKIFGLNIKESQFTWKYFLAIVHPEDRLSLQTAFVNSMKKHSVNSLEHRIITPKGVEKFVEQRWKILRDNHGQPIRAVGSCHDITERKLTEEKLFANERFLNQTQTITNLGSYTLDFSSGKWTSTAILDQIFGFDSHFNKTIEGWISIIHPEWQTIMRDYLNDVVICKKVNFNKEYKIIKVDSKEERWVHGVGEITFSKKGQPLKLIGSIQDITERKQAEEALTAREQNYLALFDASTDCIFIHDINSGIILDVNETMLKTYGYLSKEEIIGNTIEKFSLNKEPYTAKAALNYFQKTVKEGKQVFEWVARRKDNSTFWNEMILKSIKIDGEERILAVGRDISERKLIVEQLKLSSEKFQDLVNSTGGIVWESDAQTFNFTYVSKQAERLLGYSTEEWYVQGFWESHLHPEDKDKAVAYCVSQTNKMEAHDFTYRFICKKGKIIWLRDIVNVVVEDGKPRWLRGVMFDVTHIEETNLLLSESEEKYRGLVENSPDGIVIHIGTKIVFINNEGLRMMNAKSTDQMIGKSVLQFVHPDSIQHVIQRLQENAQARTVAPFVEEKLIDVNGVPFYAEIKAIPTIYEHQIAVQIVIHDISQRRQDALDLNKINRVYALISQFNDLILRTHNQKELFQEICNIAVNFGKFRMSWIGLLNDNHKIITGAFAGYEDGYFTNSNVTTILDVPEGRGPTGIALREARTVICNDIAKDKMMKPWREEALERGYSSLISIPIIVRTKKIGVFNLYSEETNFFSSEEEISLLEKITLNIAFALESILIEEDRKRNEEKIRQLSQAVEQSPVTIVITNTNGEIEYVNPKFIETTGYTAEEVMGENPRILKSGHTSPEEYKVLWQTIVSGKEWHGEFNNKRKDGTFFWESATISPIFNTEGKSTHFIAIKEDITHRKKVEKELVKSKERAEESDRLKLAFLANMSHEIRTPMNGILGFTELLKGPKLTGEEQREYIDIIEKSGKRMLNIINDIISISKVESGQVEILLSETNVNKQIEYLQTFFKLEAKQKGIKLFVSKFLSSKDAFIITDREKLYAILTNLVKNAIKFTNEGSIEFGCEKKGEMIEFFVKDTGLGISKSQKKIVFERFRQVNDSISRSHEGSGLGLTISKAYVEKLGGKIWVESKEGKGSTFYFTIPFHSESESEEKIVVKKIISEIKQENKIKDLKVLIVEDDAISKLLITIAIKPFSREILKVSTGIEAIKACHNNPDIDLVMMDINMPEMGGYEATKQIREFNKDLVIIAQTANGMQGDREEAIAAGCTDYIAKPINIIDLSELIQKYFIK